MKGIAGAVVGLTFGVGMAHAQDAAATFLVEYQFLCPGCDEARSTSLRYASDGTSILETHERARTPQIAPANDGSQYLPGERIAGPMTGFAPAIIKHWEDEVGTNFIEVPDGPALEDGARYVDLRLTPASAQPDQESWSIDNIRVTVTDGTADREIAGLQADHLTATLGYTRSEYDAAGAETANTRITRTFELWMSEPLPFSPLPLAYEPFVGNRVPPHNGGPVGTRLMAALAPEIKARGGLLRAEITTDNETVALEALSVQRAPQPPMEKFSSLPVISSDRVGQFAGPLFIASLLRDDMLSDTLTARFSLDGRELEAVSAWKTNDAGDLVIVLSAVEENTSLFLARPINGPPTPGDHGTAGHLPTDRLRAMDADALAARAARFQLNGVATNTRLPTILTGFEDGTVTISAVDGDTITGSVSGTVAELATDEVSQPRAIPVELTFEATRGLDDFRFRSVESRVAR
ncbi:hypothetical protein [Roseovarius salinarum]|uniref:hypothetical protein n=1 Tax=Roseovarius salinarum TaxID=1981892 RepID=UPI000C33ECB3|nr:hypothetical protein [Roseovarius salinarum]